MEIPCLNSRKSLVFDVISWESLLNITHLYLVVLHADRLILTDILKPRIPDPDKEQQMWQHKKKHISGFKLLQLDKISTDFIPKNLIDNRLAFIQAIALCRTGDKLLSKPMKSQFFDWYIHDQHRRANVVNKLTSCPNMIHTTLSYIIINLPWCVYRRFTIQPCIWFYDKNSIWLPSLWW